MCFYHRRGRKGVSLSHFLFYKPQKKTTAGFEETKRWVIDDWTTGPLSYLDVSFELVLHALQEPVDQIRHLFLGRLHLIWTDGLIFINVLPAGGKASFKKAAEALEASEIILTCSQ